MELGIFQEIKARSQIYLSKNELHILVQPNNSKHRKTYGKVKEITQGKAKHTNSIEKFCFLPLAFAS